MVTLDQKSLERRSLARNEVLFRQGDNVTTIYFVEAGRLQLERRTFDGRLLVVGTTPAGEFFVEAALFSATTPEFPAPRKKFPVSSTRESVSKAPSRRHYLGL
jgi:CRP-like cAMP-binding protein